MLFRSAKGLALRHAFQGRSAADAETAGQAFAQELLAKRILPDAGAMLAAHLYIGALGQILGVDAVLCPDLESSEEGIYTGRLNGPNVRGPEKTRVLRDWLLIPHDRTGRPPRVRR